MRSEAGRTTAIVAEAPRAADPSRVGASRVDSRGAKKTGRKAATTASRLRVGVSRVAP